MKGLGLVAFLDILGFKNHVSRDEFDDLSRRYIEVVETAVAGSACEYALASDSVILTVNGINVNAARTLISVTSKLCFRTLMELGLPMRGGIASGLYGRQTNANGGVLVAGPAVVAAYHLEQSQVWIGAMIGPGVLEALPEIGALASHGMRGAYQQGQNELGWALSARRWPILLREGKTFDGFAVIPHTVEQLERPADAAHLQNELERMTRRLDELKIRAPDIAAQKKYELAHTFVSATANEAHDMSVLWGDHLRQSAQGT